METEYSDDIFVSVKNRADLVRHDKRRWKIRHKHSRILKQIRKEKETEYFPARPARRVKTHKMILD